MTHQRSEDQKRERERMRMREERGERRLSEPESHNVFDEKSGEREKKQYRATTEVEMHRRRPDGVAMQNTRYRTLVFGTPQQWYSPFMPL